ncbi:MAG: L-aspartate oxidase [Planctomycetota bacterium]
MRTRPIVSPPSVRYLIGFDTRRLPQIHPDVIVLGAGIAGAIAALRAADAGCTVLLLAKDELGESNTAYAQGGIAGLVAEDERDAGDDLERHVGDTLRAGDGLCDPAAVRDLLAQSDHAIAVLCELGCAFDRNAAGHIALTREGGHSKRRVLHAQGDATGQEIARSLVAAIRAHPGITVREHTFAIDLLTVDGRASGVLFEQGGERYVATAEATVLATGGCGRVYRETTNPRIATGDGLAMAYRAGADLADMEFVQFHPTTLYVAGRARLLITEAMRGEGAYLKNHAGERFMEQVHPDAELAPRNVVSTAILRQIVEADVPHVWLDATHLPPGYVERRFPNIHRACASIGIDIGREWIPVHPSAHYHCGGVLVDAAGATTIPGLFACGEVACTGLHGANRLASNSLLEGVITGLRCGQGAAAAQTEAPAQLRLCCDAPRPSDPFIDVADLLNSLRTQMWKRVGILRHAADLASVRRGIGFWSEHQAHAQFPDRSGWQLQNALLVGRLIATAAEQRPGSVGTHLRGDDDGSTDHTHHLLRRCE